MIIKFPQWSYNIPNGLIIHQHFPTSGPPKFAQIGILGFVKNPSGNHQTGEREKLDDQGCQMVCFRTKNPNLGKFWRVLRWKMLVYFMDTWSILRSFDIFYGHLV
jgi:hypothetical protein